MITIQEDNKTTASNFAKKASAMFAFDRFTAPLVGPQMYKDPILTELQEMLQNSRDAQADIGVITPVKVTLPTLGDPQLVVKDHGKGMTPEEVAKYLIGYGVSSKRDSNTSMGHKGLGFKILLAKAQVFVQTIKDGMKYNCLLKQNEEGVPAVYEGNNALVPTDEPSGTTISYVVKERDFIHYRRAILKIIFWYPKGAVEVEGLEANDKPLYFEDYFKGQVSMVPNSVLAAIGLPTGSTLLKQGAEAYKLADSSSSNLSQILDQKTMQEVSKMSNYSFTTVIDVPIGTVAVTTTREGIDFQSKMTTQGLSTLIPNLVDGWKDALARLAKQMSFDDIIKIYHGVDNTMLKILVKEAPLTQLQKNILIWPKEDLKLFKAEAKLLQDQNWEEYFLAAMAEKGFPSSQEWKDLEKAGFKMFSSEQDFYAEAQRAAIEVSSHSNSYHSAYLDRYRTAFLINDATTYAKERLSVAFKNKCGVSIKNARSEVFQISLTPEQVPEFKALWTKALGNNALFLVASTLPKPYRAAQAAKSTPKREKDKVYAKQLLNNDTQSLSGSTSNLIEIVEGSYFVDQEYLEKVSTEYSSSLKAKKNKFFTFLSYLQKKDKKIYVLNPKNKAKAQEQGIELIDLAQEMKTFFEEKGEELKAKASSSIELHARAIETINLIIKNNESSLAFAQEIHSRFNSHNEKDLLDICYPEAAMKVGVLEDKAYFLAQALNRVARYEWCREEIVKIFNGICS